MTPRLAIAALLCLSLDGREQPDAETVSAFVNVSVIPMDSERVLPMHTVVVRDGVIAEVGPASRVRPPAGASIIDGRGRWLMPGLADMHTHTTEPSDLLLYVANGVTTVLDQGWAPLEFVAHGRQAIERGEAIGPRVFAALRVNQPFGRTPGVRTPDEARAAVDSAARHGYEFIKAYSFLGDSAFLALADESRRRGLGLVGHGVRSVGLERGLAAGQVMVSHAEEYIYTYFDDRTEGVDLARASDVTRRTGAWVVPNLSAYEAIGMQWGDPARVESYLADPAARLLRPSIHEAWRRAVYARRPSAQGDTIRARLAFLSRLTAELARGGVPLLLGTDAPTIPGVPPGSSVAREIELLQQAGLTPYEVLTAGTRSAGEFIARTVPNAERAGVVAAGTRADLLLLDANPLESVANVRRIAGVMVRGRWLPAPELRRVVDSVVAGYR